MIDFLDFATYVGGLAGGVYLIELFLKLARWLRKVETDSQKIIRLLGEWPKIEGRIKELVTSQGQVLEQSMVGLIQQTSDLHRYMEEVARGIKESEDKESHDG
ncbi:MAG: hypothetical protein HYU86_00510 [Chloroflexi bacterium]|nr:hypothetical protein [Chloroflexota bacterium]